MAVPIRDADLVAICTTLIRFDTTNYGDGNSNGERDAADWVAGQLQDAGYLPTVIEAEPGRASTVVRITGRDRAAPALLVHGHLDVVPAAAQDWSVDPFGGAVRDGAVWGRGALDMKSTDAAMLAIALAWARAGYVPPRDVVLAFVADEEDNGEFGAGYLVRERAELFAGVTTAIGESGGYSVYLPDGRRLYPIACAERGTARIKLTARGTAGHGSRPNPANAVATLARVVARLADHRWPRHIIPAVQALLDGLGDERLREEPRRRDAAAPKARVEARIHPSAASGGDSDPLGRGDRDDVVTALGDAARLLEATLSNTLNPTMLSAGYKVNVVPSEAVAWLDGRVLPGTADEFFGTLNRLAGPEVSCEVTTYAAPIETPHDTPEFAAMVAAVRAHDPDALVLPCCASGGTDAKAFSSLGIACYGFAPARWPPGFAHWNYVHGVDERVPIESLVFGARVLGTYLGEELA